MSSVAVGRAVGVCGAVCWLGVLHCTALHVCTVLRALC